MALDALRQHVVRSLRKAREELLAIDSANLTHELLVTWYQTHNEEVLAQANRVGGVFSNDYGQAIRGHERSPPEVLADIRTALVDLLDESVKRIEKSQVNTVVTATAAKVATATMDKEKVLRLAPEYYMLALYLHFQYPQEYYTDDSWAHDFTSDDYCYVEIAALRAEAVRLMQKQGAISVIEDPFGPTIWQKTEDLEALAERLENSSTSPFFRAKASGNPRAWLQQALARLNHTAEEFELTTADFASEPVDIWEPITLDQTEPVVAEATKRLNEVTEAVEQDNGYSIAHPQERDAVVSDLKGGLEKLKSGVVSTGWVTRTVAALKTVSGRFAGTIKGQAIDGALAAIKEMVKSHMTHALEALWKLFIN